MGADQRPMTASIDFLEEAERAESRDFSLAEVLHIEGDDGPDVAFLRVQPSTQALATPLTISTSQISARQQVAVIGYPARDSRIPEQQLMEDIFGNVYDKKRLAPGEIIWADRARVEHDCSTLGGNSGSVVLDLVSGEAVALHFAGRFLKANYAVPGEVILERLAQVGRGARRTRPADTRGEAKSQPQVPAANPDPIAMPSRLTVTVPITITVDVGTPIQQEPGLVRSAKPTTPSVSTGDDEVSTEGRPEDYLNRTGYDPNFLGVQVMLPEMIARAEDVLTFEQEGRVGNELKYQHFSVVMSRSRRLCFFSAVNIDGKKSRRSLRGGWLMDPRISPHAQILKECYGNSPKFSRGHMTRREDPAWGDEVEADLGNRDSMHVTNTVPQLQLFNAGVWLALENYALQNARHDRMRISVFTGPFLRADDPEEYGVLIPVRFWKVIAFIHDKTSQLCATGYTMSQKEALNGREFVFGQHETTQTAIGVIEAQTGLSFDELRRFDPLVDTEESRDRMLLTDTNQIRFF
jgi:endonuclease G